MKNKTTKRQKQIRDEILKWAWEKYKAEISMQELVDCLSFLNLNNVYRVIRKKVKGKNNQK